MKLSICGSGPGLEKTTDDGHVWCTSSAFKMLEALSTRVDKVFQLHANREVWEPWLKEIETKAVLINPYYGLIKAQILPAQKLVDKYGFRFGSSIAWMLAYAVELGEYSEIDIRGVHMAHVTEYGIQRDTFFFFCGVAEARGIRVNIPTDSGVFIGDHKYGVV